MAAFRKLAASIFSECGNNLATGEETQDWSSNKDNVRSKFVGNLAESGEQSDKESYSEEALRETNLPVKKGKRKSGPKAMWSTELLNDLVDIVANNDSYKRKLIFTNMPKASNAEVCRNIVKDMNSRCQEPRKHLR